MVKIQMTLLIQTKKIDWLLFIYLLSFYMMFEFDSETVVESLKIIIQNLRQSNMVLIRENNELKQHEYELHEDLESLFEYDSATQCRFELIRFNRIYEEESDEEESDDAEESDEKESDDEKNDFYEEEIQNNSCDLTCQFINFPDRAKWLLDIVFPTMEHIFENVDIDYIIDELTDGNICSEDIKHMTDGNYKFTNIKHTNLTSTFKRYPSYAKWFLNTVLPAMEQIFEDINVVIGALTNDQMNKIDIINL